MKEGSLGTHSVGSVECNTQSRVYTIVLGVENPILGIENIASGIVDTVFNK